MRSKEAVADGRPGGIGQESGFWSALSGLAFWLSEHELVSLLTLPALGCRPGASLHESEAWEVRTEEGRWGKGRESCHKSQMLGVGRWWHSGHGEARPLGQGF